MSDWTEAAAETAVRARKAQQAINDLGAGPDTSVRVSKATKAALEKIQQEFAAKHPGATITVDGVIAGLLADRKPVQP